MMTAIWLSDRFASPAERQTAFQQPQQGFQPQPSAAPNAPQPFADRPPYEAERQGGMIAGVCAPAGSSRATGFRIEVRDPTARSRTAMRVIATIDKDATAVPGLPALSRSPAAARAGADAAAPPGLPSFITAARGQ